MSKKGTKALASATLLSLVLTTALSAGPVKAAATGQTTRIAGADRYATAAAVATKDGKTNDNVVLVSGEGYADAVSGSVLAKTIDAPILLTQSNTLSADTTKALNTLKPKNIYVIGGTASVSKSIRDQLKDGGYNLVELGGANRYETNVAVANELVKNHGISADKVMVVGGEGFSDALSVAPVAAAKGQILLLGSNNQNDMKSVIDFVNTNKSNATVVGTSNIMNDSILKALGVNPSTRINGGADRFATNLNVLKAFSSDLKADSIYVANATADDGYADALVASALAGKTASPLILVDTDDSSATSNALSYYNSEKTDSTSTYVVGGEGVISKDLYVKFGGTDNSTPGTGESSVKSIDSVDLNQIKIVFGTDVDSDSAEAIGNYKVDGTTLTNKDAVAQLQDDNRTVLITLKQPKEQNKSYTVSVKSGILTADKTGNIDSKEQSITFGDTAAPTVTSVTPRGGNKLTVKFSEPIKVPVKSLTKFGDNNDDVIAKDGKYNPATDFTSKFKINGQNIASFGLSSTNTVTKYAVPTTTGTSVWADEVDFYFSSQLPSGSNTLEINDGTSDANSSNNSGVLVDSAGYIFKDSTQSFTIDSVTSKPTVKSVDAEADGTIWVRFDRPMDDVTARNNTNYEVNSESISSGNNKYGKGTISLKEGDTAVKITGLTSLPFGSNSIYIKNNVKDAYGNTVDDDTRKSFDVEKDETKPTVNSVTMVDSETIRIVFSKDINKDYAENHSNYTLKDSDGVDITDRIRLIKPAKMSDVDSDTQTDINNSSDNDNDSVWDIKMKKHDPNNQNDDWRLTGSKYTLTIKNLVDTTFKQNVMDDKTVTLNGSDDVSPRLTGAYRKTKDADSNDNSYKHKVVLTFSEAMDSSTLNDISNYQYKNGANDSKTLPSGTTATPGNDNKSVTLEFPTSYYIYDGKDTTTTVDSSSTLIKDLDNDDLVKGILASGLKDVAGNSIDSFNNSFGVTYDNTSSSFAYKNSTYTMENSGDDLLVKVQFASALDSNSLIPENFKVAGQKPDAVYMDGSNVVLRFNKGTASDKKAKALYNLPDEQANKEDPLDRCDVVRHAGANAVLSVNGNVKDITGASISNATTGGAISVDPSDSKWYTVSNNIGHDSTANKDVQVYSYNAAPKTTSDYWYATADQNIASGTSQAAIVLTFDTQLDQVYSSVSPDNFRFSASNGELIPSSMKIKGNSLVFLFNNDDVKKANSINVSVKNDDSLKLKSLRDANGGNATYVPTDSDTGTRNVKVISSSSTFINDLLNN
ncbi:cell wall-binding repeat-containing protein [Clostridium fermenticellae]|uniref:Cell wall-binding repeat-containing protein n=1 Tax=Clostridium fermenticellae TaxID=2068654 RepID=A0A386H0Y6_9CLOT|nr:cell wall-binding repeat-containing protein [Clostridium fermenticellae]AYD39320.1 cell wall-binding repeat-containing protein [Clostridium fermenticellae]